VVCIAKRWTSPIKGPEPKNGDICKIVGMNTEKMDDGEGFLVSPFSGVWLILAGFEALFCSGQFRALQERPAKTDISELRKLLIVKELVE
jgi:hypothetical protein